MEPKDISFKAITSVQQKILTYYHEQGRVLAWRQTTDPYKILLSEIMLQQTQVSRVKEYYARWIRRFPTIVHLARAHKKSILKEWMGLGYNSRALNLHRTAKLIAREYRSDVLTALDDYKRLPGIGPYTQAAVKIFATNADLVTVDTNIRRILIHEFSLPKTTPDIELWTLAKRLLPQGKSRDWHNALMDYGSHILTSRSTGIAPKSKQSTFKESDRDYRARILKVLLKEPYTFDGLHSLCGIDAKRLQRILDKLVKTQTIRYKNDCYSL
jgi:A/G-specific adenine glycosylase